MTYQCCYTAMTRKQNGNSAALHCNNLIERCRILTLPLLLALTVAGLFMAPSMCEEISWSPWVKSSDKQISVRLGTVQRLYAARQPTMLCVSIRNDSDRKLDLLAPWGDWFFALSTGLKITRDNHSIKYTGPMKEYVLGRDSFCVIESGKIVEKCADFAEAQNQLDLSSAGKYTASFTYYSPAGEYQKMGFNFDNPWEGKVEVNSIAFERKAATK